MPEVADIFRAYVDTYRRKHNLPGRMIKVMNAVENCRTAKLGGHIDECDECGHIKISYNSCRNRHCPKCQSLAKERWLLDRKNDLLPAEYFHIVFTIPDTLNPLTLRNQKELYTILFKSVSETLLELGKDSKYLGADIGFIGVLHTCGQNLMDHLHIHCIVPGGGLSFDSKRWIPSRDRFFIPIKVLSRLFRGKFLAYLKNAYKDYKEQNKSKLMTIDAHEFIRRFLMQVLPDKFVKIRHYGILSNRNRRTKLRQCKELLGVKIEQLKEKKGWQELLLELTGKDPRRCPCCKTGRLVRKEFIGPLGTEITEIKKLIA